MASANTPQRLFFRVIRPNNKIINEQLTAINVKTTCVAPIRVIRAIRVLEKTAQREKKKHRAQPAIP